jgi:hypothetical protein
MGAEPHQSGNAAAKNEGDHNEWSVWEPLDKFDVLIVSLNIPKCRMTCDGEAD